MPDADFMSTSSSSSRSTRLGPMVDDGAPNNAIGSTEQQLLRGSKNLYLDPLPEQISDFKFWQFCFADH